MSTIYLLIFNSVILAMWFSIIAGIMVAFLGGLSWGVIF